MYKMFLCHAILIKIMLSPAFLRLRIVDIRYAIFENVYNFSLLRFSYANNAFTLIFTLTDF